VRAGEAVREHAESWWSTQANRLQRIASKSERPICATLVLSGQELFIDWYEGGLFLEAILHLNRHDTALKLTGVSEYLDEAPIGQVAWLSLVQSEHRTPEMITYFGRRLELAAAQVRDLILRREADLLNSDASSILPYLASALICSQGALGSTDSRAVYFLRACMDSISETHTSIDAERPINVEALKESLGNIGALIFADIDVLRLVAP
jgi:hypothetical protein